MESTSRRGCFRCVTRRASALLSGGIAVGALAAVVACGSKSAHPGEASGCGPGIDCIGIGSPPMGGSTSDAAGDAAHDAETTDAAFTTLSFGGEVHTSSTFTRDPSIEPLDTHDTALFARTTVRGVVTDVAVTAGHFTVANMDATPSLVGFAVGPKDATTGAFTARTIDLLPFDGTFSTIDKPVPVPIFDATLPQTWAVTLGVPVTTSATATLVFQLTDATGAGVPNVVATIGDGDAGTSGACNGANPCGPYYDDNADGLTTSGTGTKSRGTVVFLAVPVSWPGSIVFRQSSTELARVSNLSTARDAVTFLRARVL